MDQEKGKVVAFLGPIASYTHQVSKDAPFSARIARYKQLAKENFQQVRHVKRRNLIEQSCDLYSSIANSYHRPQRNVFQSRSTRSSLKQVSKTSLQPSNPVEPPTAWCRLRTPATAPWSSLSTSSPTLQAATQTSSSAMRSIYPSTTAYLATLNPRRETLNRKKLSRPDLTYRSGT